MQVLLDLRKQEIEPTQLSPSAVLLHVYDVEEDLRAMNHFLVFSMEDIALGGAFHVGIEVFCSGTHDRQCCGVGRPEHPTNHKTTRCQRPRCRRGMRRPGRHLPWRTRESGS